MSLLKQVKRGVIAQRPLRLLLYGVPGVGKSTFAAQAPAPIFLDCEEGTQGLDVDRVAITQWGMVPDAIRDLAHDDHGYRTVVIDTLDALERMLAVSICRDARVKSIEEVGGGFGKGWTRVEEAWTRLHEQLAMLQTKRGMNVIALAHAAASTFNDPAREGYQRWTLRTNKRTAQPWMGWSEEVLFATFAVDARRGKAKRGSGRRILETEWREGLDAKNRRNLPPQMPLDWGPFAEALRAGVRSSRKATERAEAESVEEPEAPRQEPEPGPQRKPARARQFASTDTANTGEDL